MIDEMVNLEIWTRIGYHQRGEALPELEWVMHPTVFQDLARETAEASGALAKFVQIHAEDDHWEFMHHPIREDVEETGWRLQPV